MTTTALIGDALLTKIAELDSTLTVTQKATICGYLKDNGKVAYVDFYTALIEAKGYNVPDDNEEEEMSDTESDLRERYSDEAVDAFLELWDGDDLEYFEEAYQGEFRDGAEFAEQLVSDCYGMPREVPSFVEINWEATWENLRYDYCEQDGFIFSVNW